MAVAVADMAVAAAVEAAADTEVAAADMEVEVAAISARVAVDILAWVAAVRGAPVSDWAGALRQPVRTARCSRATTLRAQLTCTQAARGPISMRRSSVRHPRLSAWIVIIITTCTNHGSSNPLRRILDLAAGYLIGITLGRIVILPVKHPLAQRGSVLKIS